MKTKREHLQDSIDFYCREAWAAKRMAEAHRYTIKGQSLESLLSTCSDAELNEPCDLHTYQNWLAARGMQ
jgi:hypothetical protein